MTPSPLPLNGIALLAVFPSSLHNGKQLSVQHKHRIIMVCTICSSRCVCVPSFLDCPTPPPFLYPFTQPLSAPVLGARPGFRQGSVCSQPWQPAMLLLLAPCPAILETSQLFALLPPTIPLQPDRSPKGQQTHPSPDSNTLKLLDPHLPRKGEALSV